MNPSQELASAHGRDRRCTSARCLPLLLLAIPLARADVFETIQSDGTPLYSNHPKSAASRLVVSDGRPISSSRRAEIERLIELLALEHGLPPSLVLAVVTVESGFDPFAVSNVGAQGLMQLMPNTAARYGVRDPFDARQNLVGGMRYLKDLLQQHGGNVTLALSSYNAGPATVANYGRRIPPYRETMLFVASVLAIARQHDLSRGSHQSELAPP